MHNSDSQSATPSVHLLRSVGSWAILVAAFATSPWLYLGTLGAIRSNTNDPRQWLPRGFQEAVTYQWLQDHFGNDEMTVVSWPGCVLGDPRAGQLAEALLRESEPSYFERATTGDQLLQKLRAPPLDLSRNEAIRRLSGVMVGPDGKTTCLVLTVSERGKQNRAAAVAQILETAQQQVGIPPDQLRLGGATVDGATIDIESRRMLVELSCVSGAIALLITWSQLRSVRMAVLILINNAFCTTGSLAFLYYTGGHMNLTMTMLPALVSVLSMSGAIHIINYYRAALLTTSDQSAPWRAVRDGWQPCTLSSLTTAIGLSSLAVSNIVPVKMFGIYSAAGVLLTLLGVLVLIPAGLTVWPPSASRRNRHRERAGDSWLVNTWAEWVWNKPAWIIMTFIVGLGLTAYGLTRLHSTVSLYYRFGAASRILQDYGWLEQNVGPLSPLELVIHFNDVSEDSLWSQLDHVRSIEQVVRRHGRVGATLSASSFAPPQSRSTGMQRVIRQAVLRRSAGELEQRMQAAGLVAHSADSQRLWRISVRTSALSYTSSDRLTEELKVELDPIIENVPGATITYTGVLPLMYRAQRSLLSDLTTSFMMAFALISLVMMFYLRSIAAGLVAMLPNIIPVVMVFGFMGWLDIWIEIGTIMTASVAMGIAVDDTLHLLTWYRRVAVSTTAREAVRRALAHCAKAMVLTTLTCSCAMLVFSYSSFMPIRRFAWLMAAQLFVGLVGDLVLLPALLSTRLGKLFQSRSTAREPDEP
ncbi:MAG: MMPL family transporter [Pirellulaceae bacterium]|nr:MMPL family transporter [Pirellulaceae bacterium]